MPSVTANGGEGFRRDRVPRCQPRGIEVIPTIVSNKTSFVKGTPGEPVRISWDATALFDEAFTEAGGPWDPAAAGRLKENVFSTGNTRDPADSYRAFRGRDPGIAALMRKRGFPVPATSAPAGAPASR
jgi:hypothetical protein